MLISKRIALVALVASQLTACATSPFNLASMLDSADTCQRTELIKTGQYPSWCGAGSGKVKLLTQDYTTGRALTTTKVQTK